MEESALRTLEYRKIIERLADKAGSSLGKELAVTLIPSNVFTEVQDNLLATKEGYSILQASPNVPLGGMRDLRPMLKKARLGAILNAADLLDCAGALYALRKIKRFFKELTLDTPKLHNLAKSIEILGQLEQQINCIVDEHGAIREDASIELQRIRREIRQSQSRVKERLDSILRSAEYQKYFQDVLVTMRGDRYVIPVKQEYRQYFPGIVHDQSSSGATLFIEPMAIVNLNNDIKQLIVAEKHELERILKAVTQAINKQSAILYNNCDIFAQLDFIFAKAKLAQDMNASYPEINEHGYVDIKQARHPLITGAKVVPIDIVLGKTFNTLLITGPNTGGKTVSMKTLGLIALMAQSGLFIPALPDSEIAVFHNIFTDIGDEQSIEQSLSTFSAHMTHLVEILSQIESSDLLLIDEIGAGTDPEEGAALAMAILEHLMKIGTKVVATTHYSELKTFAYSRDGIENASVEFDINTLRPTYRLLIGIPGASNAFSISKRLGLAESLILRAKQLIDADHAQFEKILNTLESEKLMYEQKNAEISERQHRLALLEQKINTKTAEFTEKKEKMLQKAREDSAEMVRRTRREAEQIIAELKAQFNDQGIQKRQEAIERSRLAIKESMQQSLVANNKLRPTAAKPLDAATVQVGDSVYISTLDQKGTVLEVQGKNLFVQIGILKTTLPLAVCMAIEGEETATAKHSKSKTMNFSKIQKVRREIDIRGMLVYDAEVVLDRFIDDAVLAGLSQVLVIHGKGTGALRKGVRSYLKSHRNVQDISIGELNEGGDGATVVQLR